MADEDKKTEITFHLTEPVKYHHQGDEHEGTFVVLTAPTSKNRRECAVLKQAFFRALNEVTGEERSGEKEKDGQEDITGEDVIMMVGMSSVSLDDFLETGRKLFTSGVAKVDGSEKMTIPLLDRVSMDDMERMLGDYLVGFTLRSALKKLKSS